MPGILAQILDNGAIRDAKECLFFIYSDKLTTIFNPRKIHKALLGND